MVTPLSAMYAEAGLSSVMLRFITVNRRSSDCTASVGSSPSTALTVQVDGDGGRTVSAKAPSFALTYPTRTQPVEISRHSDTDQDAPLLSRPVNRTGRSSHCDCGLGASRVSTTLDCAAAASVDVVVVGVADSLGDTVSPCVGDSDGDTDPVEVGVC